MLILLAVLAAIAVLSLIGLALSLRIVQQYEEGVLFRLGPIVTIGEAPRGLGDRPKPIVGLEEAGAPTFALGARAAEGHKQQMVRALCRATLPSGS